MGFFDDIIGGIVDSFNDTVDGAGKIVKEYSNLPKTQTLFKAKEERKDKEYLKLKRENNQLKAKLKKQKEEEEPYKVKYKSWGSW